MTQEKLKYANDLNEKIHNCKLLSEIFCKSDKDRCPVM